MPIPMDVTGLHTICHDSGPLQPNASPLAGGTWLMSEARSAAPIWQDLAGRGWDDCRLTATHLEIGAMVPLAELPHQLDDWPGASKLAVAALDATSASDKILRQATLGGNLALALPFGIANPLAQLWCAAVEVLSATGEPRWLDADQLQLGVRQTVLGDGELVRRIRVPLAELQGNGASTHLRLNAASPPTLSVWLWPTPRAGETVRAVVSAGVAAPRATAGSTVEELLGAFDELEFLDDDLGPASYRHRILPILLNRAWQQLQSDSPC